MSWEQKLRNDYWSEAKRDNLKDLSTHNITVILGWFLRAILAGLRSMLIAFVNVIKLFLHF